MDWSSSRSTTSDLWVLQKPRTVPTSGDAPFSVRLLSLAIWRPRFIAEQVCHLTWPLENLLCFHRDEKVRHLNICVSFDSAIASSCTDIGNGLKAAPMITCTLSSGPRNASTCSLTNLSTFSFRRWMERNANSCQIARHTDIRLLFTWEECHIIILKPVIEAQLISRGWRIRRTLQAMVIDLPSEAL